VLAQYRQFWATLTPASQTTATRRRVLLEPVSADPELTSLLAGISRDRARGRVYYGQPVTRGRITQLSTAKGVAVVRDCQDASQTGDKDMRSGKLLTKGTTRTLVVTTLHAVAGGTWKVVFVSFPRQSC
jgi:hypothetical protein